MTFPVDGLRYRPAARPLSELEMRALARMSEEQRRKYLGKRLPGLKPQELSGVEKWLNRITVTMDTLPAAVLAFTGVEPRGTGALDTALSAGEAAGRLAERVLTLPAAGLLPRPSDITETAISASRELLQGDVKGAGQAVLDAIPLERFRTAASELRRGDILGALQTASTADDEILRAFGGGAGVLARAGLIDQPQGGPPAFRRGVELGQQWSEAMQATPVGTAVSILFDPTTYASFGTAGIAKAAGRLGVRLAPRLAARLLSSTAGRTALRASEIGLRAPLELGLGVGPRKAVPFAIGTAAGQYAAQPLIERFGQDNPYIAAAFGLGGSLLGGTAGLAITPRVRRPSLRAIGETASEDAFRASVTGPSTRQIISTYAYGRNAPRPSDELTRTSIFDPEAEGSPIDLREPETFVRDYSLREAGRELLADEGATRFGAVDEGMLHEALDAWVQLARAGAPDVDLPLPRQELLATPEEAYAFSQKEFGFGVDDEAAERVATWLEQAGFDEVTWMRPETAAAERAAEAGYRSKTPIEEFAPQVRAGEEPEIVAVRDGVRFHLTALADELNIPRSEDELAPYARSLWGESADNLDLSNPYVRSYVRAAAAVAAAAEEDITFTRGLDRPWAVPEEHLVDDGFGEYQAKAADALEEDLRTVEAPAAFLPESRPRAPEAGETLNAYEKEIKGRRVVFAELESRTVQAIASRAKEEGAPVIIIRSSEFDPATRGTFTPEEHALRNTIFRTGLGNVRDPQGAVAALPEGSAIIHVGETEAGQLRTADFGGRTVYYAGSVAGALQGKTPPRSSAARDANWRTNVEDALRDWAEKNPGKEPIVLIETAGVNHPEGGVSVNPRATRNPILETRAEEAVDALESLGVRPRSVVAAPIIYYRRPAQAARLREALEAGHSVYVGPETAGAPASIRPARAETAAGVARIAEPAPTARPEELYLSQAAARGDEEDLLFEDIASEGGEPETPTRTLPEQRDYPRDLPREYTRAELRRRVVQRRPPGETAAPEGAEQSAGGSRPQQAPVRVLIAGSRASSWSPQQARTVQQRLQRLIDSLPEGSVVIEGGASGVDRWAGQYARQRGLQVIEVPADWQKYGRRAGHLRNQKMLDEHNPDVVVVVTPDKASMTPGSADMARRARSAGKKVYTFDLADDQFAIDLPAPAGAAQRAGGAPPEEGLLEGGEAPREAPLRTLAIRESTGLTPAAEAPASPFEPQRRSTAATIRDVFELAGEAFADGVIPERPELPLHAQGGQIRFSQDGSWVPSEGDLVVHIYPDPTGSLGDTAPRPFQAVVTQEDWAKRGPDNLARVVAERRKKVPPGEFVGFSVITSKGRVVMRSADEAKEFRPSYLIGVYRRPGVKPQDVVTFALPASSPEAAVVVGSAIERMRPALKAATGSGFIGPLETILERALAVHPSYRTLDPDVRFELAERMGEDLRTALASADPSVAHSAANAFAAWAEPVARTAAKGVRRPKKPVLRTSVIATEEEILSRLNQRAQETADLVLKLSEPVEQQVEEIRAAVAEAPVAAPEARPEVVDAADQLGVPAAALPEPRVAAETPEPARPAAEEAAPEQPLLPGFEEDPDWLAPRRAEGEEPTIETIQEAAAQAERETEVLEQEALARADEAVQSLADGSKAVPAPEAEVVAFRQEHYGPVDQEAAALEAEAQSKPKPAVRRPAAPKRPEPPPIALPEIPAGFDPRSVAFLGTVHNADDEKALMVARQIGREVAASGRTLVTTPTSILHKAAAEAALAAGGEVIIVTPFARYEEEWVSAMARHPRVTVRRAPTYDASYGLTESYARATRGQQGVLSAGAYAAEIADALIAWPYKVWEKQGTPRAGQVAAGINRAQALGKVFTAMGPGFDTEHSARFFLAMRAKEEAAADAAEARAQAAVTQSQPVEEYRWARTAPKGEGYEVSSAGDRRFSAMYARLPDGRTIEEVYQTEIKGYRSVKEGKGKPPRTGLSREETYQRYKQLWVDYLRANPELYKELREKARGKVLTDRFASTEINQARALAEILNERLVEQAQRGAREAAAPATQRPEQAAAREDARPPDAARSQETGPEEVSPEPEPAASGSEPPEAPPAQPEPPQPPQTPAEAQQREPERRGTNLFYETPAESIERRLRDNKIQQALGTVWQYISGLARQPAGVRNALKMRVLSTEYWRSELVTRYHLAAVAERLQTLMPRIDAQLSPQAQSAPQLWLVNGEHWTETLKATPEGRAYIDAVHEMMDDWEATIRAYATADEIQALESRGILAAAIAARENGDLPRIFEDRGRYVLTGGPGMREVSPDQYAMVLGRLLAEEAKAVRINRISESLFGAKGTVKQRIGSAVTEFSAPLGGERAMSAIVAGGDLGRVAHRLSIFAFDNMIAALGLTMDLSAVLMHAATVTITRPHMAGRYVAASVAAMMQKPGWYARQRDLLLRDIERELRLRNIDTPVGEWLRAHGLPYRAPIEGIDRGLDLPGLRILQPAINRAAQGFDSFLNLVTLYMARDAVQSLRGIQDQRQFSLAFADMASKISAATMHNQTRLTSLESVLSPIAGFARAFFVSPLATIGTPLVPVGSARARTWITTRYILPSFAAMLGLTYFHNQLFARDRSDTLNPFESGWLTFRNFLGTDIDVNLFPLARALNLELRAIKLRDPALLARSYAWRVRPLGRAVYEAISGRTIRGEKVPSVFTPKGALEAITRYGASGIPLSYRDMLSSEEPAISLSPAERALSLALSLTGAQAFPKSIYSRIEEVRNRLARERWGKPYDQLTGEQKATINSNPEVIALLNERDTQLAKSADSMEAAAAESRIDYRSRIQQIEEWLKRGYDDQGRPYGPREARAAIEQAQKDLVRTGESSDQELAGYYALYDLARRPDGTIDWNLLEVLQAEYKRKHPGVIEKLNSVSGQYDTPMLAELRRAREQAARYYDIPPYRGLSLEAGLRAQEVISQASQIQRWSGTDLDGALRYLLLTGQITSSDYLTAHIALRAGRNPERDIFLLQSPEYVRWYLGLDMDTLRSLLAMKYAERAGRSRSPRRPRMPDVSYLAERRPRWR